MLLACFLTLGLLGGADAAADEPIVIGGRTDFEGAYYLRLREEWGKPAKTKRHGKGGKLLVYRLRLYGNDFVGTGSMDWTDAGIGPSNAGPTSLDGERTTGRYGEPGAIHYSGSLEVLATQKVKFYVDDRGIIYEQQVFPVKWKKKMKKKP